MAVIPFPSLMIRSVLRSRLHKTRKQRMRMVRTGLEFRMSLRCHIIRMVLQLDHLNNVSIRADTRKLHSLCLINITVFVIDLISVAMALENLLPAIKLIE
mgnify:CR=1 FL=1